MPWSHPFPCHHHHIPLDQICCITQSKAFKFHHQEDLYLYLLNRSFLSSIFSSRLFPTSPLLNIDRSFPCPNCSSHLLLSLSIQLISQFFTHVKLLRFWKQCDDVWRDKKQCRSNTLWFSDVRNACFDEGMRVGCNVELPLDLHHRVKNISHFGVAVYLGMRGEGGILGRWADLGDPCFLPLCIMKGRSSCVGCDDER